MRDVSPPLHGAAGGEVASTGSGLEPDPSRSARAAHLEVDATQWAAQATSAAVQVGPKPSLSAFRKALAQCRQAWRHGLLRVRPRFLAVEASPAPDLAQKRHKRGRSASEFREQ